MLPSVKILQFWNIPILRRSSLARAKGKAVASGEGSSTDFNQDHATHSGMYRTGKESPRQEQALNSLPRRATGACHHWRQIQKCAAMQMMLTRLPCWSPREECRPKHSYTISKTNMNILIIALTPQSVQKQCKRRWSCKYPRPEYMRKSTWGGYNARAESCSRSQCCCLSTRCSSLGQP